MYNEDHPLPPGFVGQTPAKQCQKIRGSQQTNVGIAGTTTVLADLMFREVPVAIECPFCQASIVTSTAYEPGPMTWVLAGILLLFGLWLGCCLIPFCVDGCKDVIHRCPSCNQIIGKYNRM